MFGHFFIPFPDSTALMRTTGVGPQDNLWPDREKSFLGSILFPYSSKSKAIPIDTIKDLDLDRVIRSMLCNLSGFKLEHYFYELPCDVDTIEYRQAVFLDLADFDTFECLEVFSQKLGAILDGIAAAQRSGFALHAELRLLDYACKYVDLLTEASKNLFDHHTQSAALLGVKRYIRSICDGSEFVEFAKQAKELKSRLDQIEYTLLIREGTVKVEKYLGEGDYCKEVLDLFSRFSEGAAAVNAVSSSDLYGMNHVKAAILRLVSRVFSQEFRDLNQFHVSWPEFVDKKLVLFYRELAFYLVVQKKLNALTTLGNEFSIPEIYRGEGESIAKRNFDLALAIKLEEEGSSPVANDWWLQSNENVMVVTGLNHGGKTTFARAFGQLHYFAGLGCPVPAAKARLQAFEHLLTHFESEERPSLDLGRLAFDLSAAKAMLEKAGPDSILIFNEIFSSTSLKDAKFLGLELLKAISEKRARAVYVTFVDELAGAGPNVVSMAVSVEMENPERRLYTLARSAPTGKSYALMIAESYGLTRETLKVRLAR